MFDRQSLEAIADPQDLSPAEIGGKRSALLTEGHHYYGRLKKTFPAHYMSFKCMLRRGTPTVYKRSPEDFIQFILDIGPVPEGMDRPTIGRYDHSLGYFPANFRWQSHRENSMEPGKRRMENDI